MYKVHPASTNCQENHVQEVYAESKKMEEVVPSSEESIGTGSHSLRLKPVSGKVVQGHRIQCRNRGVARYTSYGLKE